MTLKLLVAIALGIYIGWWLGRHYGYQRALDDLAEVIVDPDSEDITPLHIQAQRHAGREGWQ